MKRRTFLGGAVGGGAGAVLGNCLSSLPKAEAAPVDASPTAVVPLGKHVKASRIGMGFGMRGWLRESNLSRRGLDHAKKVVRYAYEAGVRFFDNADLYGSHGYVAEALADLPRESYVLSTKIWFHPNGLPEKERPDADVAVERFLKELKTDYIDVVQIHCMSKRGWPDEMRKQMDILERLKEKGVIRAHGVSCHSLAALEAAAESDWVDVVHSRVNHKGVKMDGKPEEVVAALRKIHDAGKGVVAMKLCGEGAFRDDPNLRDESIRFVLGTGCVDVMIVGFELPEEIDDFKARVAKALTAVA
ncbi:MAG: aldo/keto reductase [Planctomycetota bacterium]|nr:MAG: aldo/keto reductase [Planctomycetota bacterium]